MNKYKIIRLIGDGTYGQVYEGVNQETDEKVAIKKLKTKYSSFEECLLQSEVRILKKLNHENIIKLQEVIREQNSDVSYIFEYCDCNLYEFIEKHRKQKIYIPEGKIRNIIYQITCGVKHLHSCNIMHRDLKPENILMILSNNLIKIADFGTAKEIPEFKDGSLTDYVCTRWYRAPECTLKSTNYNEKIDVWAIGCIMAELYTLKPIFPGSDEFDQLNKILKVTGSPTEFNDWPEGFALIQKLNIRMPNFYKSNLKDIIYNANDDAINFLENIFQINPDKRPSCSELLRHPYFTEIQRPVSYNNPVRGIRGNKIQKNFHEFSHFSDNGKNFGNLRGTVKSNYFYDNSTTNTTKFYGYNDKKDIFTSPFDLSKDKPFYSNLTHNMKSNGNENYFGNNQNEISKNSYNYYKNFNFSNYINNNGALPDIDGVFKNNLMNLRNNNAYSKYNQNDENNLINSYNYFHKNKFSSVAKNEILQNTRRDKFFSVNKRNFEDNNTTPIPFPNDNINKKNYISPFTKNRINNNYLSPSSRNIFPNIYNNYGKVY